MLLLLILTLSNNKYILKILNEVIYNLYLLYVLSFILIGEEIPYIINIYI